MGGGHHEPPPRGVSPCSLPLALPLHEAHSGPRARGGAATLKHNHCAEGTEEGPRGEAPRLPTRCDGCARDDGIRPPVAAASRSSHLTAPPPPSPPFRASPRACSTASWVNFHRRGGQRVPSSAPHLLRSRGARDRSPPGAAAGGWCVWRTARGHARSLAEHTRVGERRGGG